MNLPYRLMTLLFAGSLVSLPCLTLGAENIPSAAKTTTADKAAEKPPEKLVTPDATTQGTVDVGGQHIAYSAIAGTLTVGATDIQDVQLDADGKPQPGSQLGD